MILNKEINNNFVGERIDNYLTKVFAYNSRNRWQTMIKNESVLLNGKKIKPSTIIQKDSTVSYDIGDYEEHPVDSNYKVLLDDDDLLIIDKPGNIPVHSSGKYFTHTLINYLRNDFPEYNLNLANRLDRETSGVIVLGKNSAACKNIGDQFFNKTIKKCYIAYVFGEIKEDNFAVDEPIAEGTSSVIRIQMGVDKNRGLSAKTDFEVIKRSNGFTKLYCYPKTGRTNQIRVHLTHYGYPIIGDKLYSGNDRDFLEFIEFGNTTEMTKRLLMARQALHAHSISFKHPINDNDVKVSADLHDDMIKFEKEYM